MHNPRSGNVVIFVLIAVMLFAALAYTFMRGSREGTGNLSAQQAKIQSSEMINYAQSVERAIDKLRSKGCSETQLSFDYDIPATTGYENPNSPGDYSCHIFHPNGGGITYAASPISGSSWFFITSFVFEVGEDKGWCSDARCNDLLMMLAGLSLQTCQFINSTIQGSTSTNNQDNGTAYDTTGTKFIGDFSDGQPDIEMGSNPNKESGCIRGTDNKYYFFRAVLPR